MKRTILAAVIATLAALALAGTASADYVSTTTGGAAATPTIHMMEEAGHVTISNPIGTIACSSTVEAGIALHGPGFPVKGNIGILGFTGCTNYWHVTVSKAGSLEINHSSGHNGYITFSGTKINTTRFGVSCVYEASPGLTGSVTGGHPALVRFIGLISIEPFESSWLCGNGAATFEASYFTTSALYVASS